MPPGQRDQQGLGVEPGIGGRTGAAHTLGHSIEPGHLLQQVSECPDIQATKGLAHDGLALAEHAGGTHGLGGGDALDLQGLLDAQQLADRVGERPAEQGHGGILGSQRAGHAHGTGRVAGKRRIHQAEQLEACAVQHDLGHGFGRQLARRQQQAQPLDGLVGGQQVAFGAFGDQRQHGRCCLLLLCGQALGHPLAHGACIDAWCLHPQHLFGQSLEPGRAGGGAFQMGAGDQHAGALVQPRQQLAQRITQFTGGLGVQAKVDQPLAGKERRGLGGLDEPAAVEACIDVQHLALLEAQLAGPGTYQVGRLDDQQQFVAADPGERWQPLADGLTQLRRRADALAHGTGAYSAGRMAASRHSS